jgi:hypothetical protein
MPHVHVHVHRPKKRRARSDDDLEGTVRRGASIRASAPDAATAQGKDASDIRIVYNRLLGGWYVVRGPHQTPLNGKFESKEAAQKWLKKRGGSSTDAQGFGRGRGGGSSTSRGPKSGQGFSKPGGGTAHDPKTGQFTGNAANHATATVK